MPIRISNTDVDRPEGFNSAAVKSNGLVFTSGNVGLNYETGEYSESVEEQAHQAFKNVKKTLETSGAGLDTVLKVLLFISDGNDGPKINEIYKTYFSEKPARSCVIVQFPNPKIKLELECVAECK
ncbi:protein Hmf1p [[Candida] jaroonii]|uniref:Protein Hmf1p n=1 Tax=[Candida] jaroonii TaxID=467808 RepID=A0ACA9YBF3_9ASCO|nr:protein Hmf1p [[Candida] jaroonii]